MAMANHPINLSYNLGAPAPGFGHPQRLNPTRLDHFPKPLLAKDRNLLAMESEGRQLAGSAVTNQADALDTGISFEHQFAGQFISFSAGDLALRAAQLFLTRHPEIAARYGPRPEAKWCENFSARLADLSAALAAGRHEIFANQLAWSRTAFAARNVPVSDLRLSVEVLGEVLQDSCPPDDAALVARFIQEGLLAIDRAKDALPTELTPGTRFGTLAASFLLCIFQGDRVGASEIVLAPARTGELSLRDAYLHVFVPVQQELGRMWHMNEITVAEEHFATATIQLVMAQLLPLAKRKPFDGRIMIAGSCAGNAHELGVRFVADFFELDGWRAIYLGPNVPAEDLILAVNDFRAHLVALSACLPTQLRAVEETVNAIRQSGLHKQPKIILGGQAFKGTNYLWRDYGADGHACSADEAIAVADRLVPVVATTL
jgi:MerR family transcriptional regulator, light-induced transcriptional regulator